MCTTPNKQYADMLDVPAKPRNEEESARSHVTYCLPRIRKTKGDSTQKPKELNGTPNCERS